MVDFSLKINSWSYLTQYSQENRQWKGYFRQTEPYSFKDIEALDKEKQKEIYIKRNSFPELGLVTYTTQYALSCFEGLKAFPRKNGKLALFRAIDNSRRFKSSMEGLRKPSIEADIFFDILREYILRIKESKEFPAYNEEWEKNNFIHAQSIYLRPFSYSEPGIGVMKSLEPSVIIVSTIVGNYFDFNQANEIYVSPHIRSYKGGTGWIKASSNYVTSLLAREEALEHGAMEALFLDAEERKYIQEGSAANFFCFLKDGTLVTPQLDDTILAGITRDSVIQLAKDCNITVEERPLSLDEVLSDGVEIFLTGTAACVIPITSVNNKGKHYQVSSGKIGELSTYFFNQIRGIQYGTIEDKFNWTVEI